MKLRLTQEKGVSILNVLEDVDPRNVTVLRAGITKLLNSGKNRIILNLSDATHLTIDVARDIAKLHELAAELRGQILLVGQTELLQRALRSFAAPPGIRCFTSVPLALTAMAEVPVGGVLAEDFSLGSDPNGRLKADIAALTKENQALKAKAAGRKVDEIRKLRFENGAFAAQLEAIEEQLEALRKEKKPPFVSEATQAKIRELEDAFREFLK